MDIIYSKKAIKFINKLDKIKKQKLKIAIEKLPDGDTKAVSGYNLITNRLRLGDLRVLYYFDNGNLFIEKIGYRGNVYKGA